MKTNLRILKETMILFLLVTVFLSCNKKKPADELAVPSRNIIENTEEKQSEEGLFEAQRKKLMERANLEAEKAGKKIVELKVEQEMAKTRIRSGIEKDIKTLQARKDRLEVIWKELKSATKESLKDYEEEIEKIVKE